MKVVKGILALLVIILIGLVWHEATTVYDMSALIDGPYATRYDAAINANIDEIRLETERFNQLLYVRGWIIGQAQSLDHYNLTIGLIPSNVDKKHYYFIPVSEERFDIATHFDNSNYLNSGYQVKIPIKSLENGNYQLVALQEADNYDGMTSLNRFLIVNDNNVTLTDMSYPYHVENVLFDEIEMPHNIEALQVENEKVVISGWAYTNEDMKQIKIALLVGNESNYTVYDTKMVIREDVQQVYGREGIDDLLYSGFEAVIPKNVLPEEGNIGILMYVNGQYYCDWTKKTMRDSLK